MPITTLMLMYATSQVSTFVYVSYFSVGLVLGVSATLGGVYISQQDSTKSKDRDSQQALIDLLTLVENPSTQAEDFNKKLKAYQSLFDSQILELLRKDFELRHQQKSFSLSENTAFQPPRKKVIFQQNSMS